MRHPLAGLVRTAAGAVSGLLVATAVLTGPAAHAAPADRSGDWLADQLERNGLVHNDQYDFDDYGLTADVAVALDAVGGQARAERAARRALARHVDSWTTGVDFGSSDVYAGSVAKAIVLAQATGGDPRDFGGRNLVRRLHRRVSDDRGIAGRIQDRTSGTDYANTIGQALAGQGLAEAGSRKAGDVVRFLLDQQCSRGYFRLNFAAADAADQTCDGAARADRQPDTDVTAIALLALDSLAGKQRTRAVRAAIDDARRWLRRRQADNGGFGGGPVTEAANANSTGLAAWALAETGACKPARQAARWVKRLQVPRDAGGALAGEAGAIAYDRAGYRAAKADGITTETRDQWRRATAQAAPALAFLRLRACRR